MGSAIDLSMGYGKKLDFKSKVEIARLPSYILIGKNGNSPPILCMDDLSYAGLVDLPRDNVLVSAPFDLSRLVRSGDQVEADLIFLVNSTGVYAASTLSNDAAWASGNKRLNPYASQADLLKVNSNFELTRYGNGNPLNLSAKVITTGPLEKKIKFPSDYHGSLDDITSIYFSGTWNGNIIKHQPRIETAQGTYYITSNKLSKDECINLLGMCSNLMARLLKDPINDGPIGQLKATMASIKRYGVLI